MLKTTCSTAMFYSNVVRTFINIRQQHSQITKKKKKRYNLIQHNFATLKLSAMICSTNS